MKQPEKNKKDLDSYFDLARNEKVTYSKEDSRKLIAARVAIGSAGLLGSWGIKSLFNASSLSVIGAAAISSVLIYNAMKEDDTKQHSGKLQNSNNEIIANQAKSATADASYKLSISADKSNTSNNLNQNITVQSSTVINAKTIPGRNTELAYNYKSNSDIEPKNTNEDKNQSDINNTSVNNNTQIDNLSEATEDERSIQATNSNDYIAINESKLQSDENSFALSYNSPVISPEQVEIPESDPFGELQTILDDYSKHNGFSITANERASTLGGKSVVLSGGRIVLTMNKETSFGLMGYGVTNASIFTFKDNDGKDATGNMQMGYGALYFEHTFDSDNWIHWGLSASLGIGATKMSSLIPGDVTFNAPWSVFYTLEPGANIEFNVLSWMRVGGEISYRLSDDLLRNQSYINEGKLKDFKLSGLSTGLYFKFGMF